MAQMTVGFALKLGIEQFLASSTQAATQYKANIASMGTASWLWGSKNSASAIP